MKKWILVLCVLSLWGCAQNNTRGTATTPSAHAVSPEASWQSRQQTFARMKEWKMDGRVGLQLRGQSWSFGMDWTQSLSGRSVMDITHPLTGAVMANIQETGQQVVLKSADGKSYKDTNAERLLERHLKLKFPLNDMRYWARAVPAPAPVEDVKLDRYGRPLMLKQSGWVITYSNYQDNKTTALPRKITLEKASERAKAKVVAKKWQTRF